MSGHPRPPFRRSARGALVGALALATVLSGALIAATPAAARDGLDLTGSGSVLLQQRSTTIAPGLDLTSFQRLETGGWVTGHVMTADLRTPTLSLDVVDGGTVSASNDVVSNFAEQADAVAAVNGDYFNMNVSDAPIATNISPTTGLRSSGSEVKPALTLSNGRAAITDLVSAATLDVAGRTITADAVNSPSWVANQLAVFTPVWGSYPVGRMIGAGETVRVLHVVDGAVTAIDSDTAALAKPAAEGETLVVGRGKAATRLDGITVGAKVAVTLKASADVDLAVGGNQVLIKDGKPTDRDEVAAARTAVGVSRDGTRLWIVSIDGKVADSPGQTLAQLKQLLLDQGAYQAVNLDGGGSTTLVARPAGTSDLQVIDRPSDGQERLVTNALVFRSSAKGRDTGVQARAALDPQSGLAAAGSNDLLPGLSRTLVATGLAADHSATTPRGTFLTRGRTVRTVGGDQRTRTVVRAERSGRTTVDYLGLAGGRPVREKVDLQVHGELTRIEPSVTVLSLADSEASAPLSVTALDADGHRVPVETRDVKVKAGSGLRVEPAGPASFTVSGTGGSLKASSVQLGVLGRSVTVPVTIGYQEKVLADFTDAASWKSSTARATGTVAPAEGHDGTAGLALDFDFTQSTATRGMFANPPAPITIAGQPQALTLWIKGTGKGEWPRLQVTRGDGTVTNLDGDHIDWEGWRQVTFPIPAGTAYPLTLTAIRFMEIRSDVSYTDQLAISDLRALIPADVDQPPAERVADPALLTQGSVDRRPLRVAVLSDTQFVARDGENGQLVQAGRRALREIVKARPEHLFIVGDFVDEASPADFALAKKVLDEEVTGKVDWTYLPGNHEVMGGAITNFEQVFGPTRTARVIDGTLFVTLDSSAGQLHAGGTDQLQLLQQQLTAAAKNRAVTGVVVLHHHPIDDPHPDKGSQLTDRAEAAALQRELADFRARTGKSIAEVNGHVGTFHADAVDGVTRFINGNSGKNPSGSPAEGGFTGWSMLGIEPRAGVVGATPSAGTDRARWLAIETRARVDALTVSAPAALKVRGTATASATVTQDGGREVPVGWPVTATWGGRGVQVVGERADHRDVLRIDPVTGRLVALRPGKAELSVTVNGVTKTTTVTVSR